MPELPEVETVKRTLEKNYLNRTIVYCEVLLPRMILSPLDEFITNTKNTKIISIARKGKFLIFPSEYPVSAHSSFSPYSFLTGISKPLHRSTEPYPYDVLPFYWSAPKYMCQGLCYKTCSLAKQLSLQQGHFQT